MKQIKLIVIILAICQFAIAQNNVRFYTLNDVIELAKVQSSDALNAKHLFRGSYWQFKNYKAGMLPLLKFNTMLPNFSRMIDKIPGIGGDVFSKRDIASYSAELLLSQNIAPTGGQLFLSSSLQRIDILSAPYSKNYMATPISIGINQPLFDYNTMKWAKKIEPLKYNEAKQLYIENLEQLSIKTVNLFFNLLDAQIRLKIQKDNLANNDTLFQIAKGRFNIGTIAENELLQIELGVLNAKLAVRQAELDFETALFSIKSFLRISDSDSVVLEIPNQPNLNNINPLNALNSALQNNSAVAMFDIQLIESESSIQKAKAASRFNANILATYGFTNSSGQLVDTYKNPDNQQKLMINIQVPLIDWGQGKSAVKMAQSNSEIIKNSVKQQKIDFEKDIIIKINRFNIFSNQLDIALRSKDVSLKRYEVTKQRYLIGKIGVIDLNLAQTEKDNAQQNYINELRQYWQNYYEIRKLTHFDFIKNKLIDIDYTKLTEN